MNIRRFAGMLVLALVLVPALALAEKEAIRDDSGEIIGYKETVQEGNKSVVTWYGPDGVTVLKQTTTEVEERDDGTVVTTITEVVVVTKPDGTKVTTTTITVIEEYPEGPIAKKISKTIIVERDKQGVKTIQRGVTKITIIDNQGNVKHLGKPMDDVVPDVPWNPESPTPVGARE
ncbi:MAG: hypothetical protein JXR37_06485 [Kiritimatiellae bacterium]|nr:hypothetical protein [Kiritimatiellia bacterium]